MKFAFIKTCLSLWLENLYTRYLRKTTKFVLIKLKASYIYSIRWFLFWFRFRFRFLFLFQFNLCRYRCHSNGIIIRQQFYREAMWHTKNATKPAFRSYFLFWLWSDRIWIGNWKLNISMSLTTKLCLMLDFKTVQYKFYTNSYATQTVASLITQIFFHHSICWKHQSIHSADGTLNKLVFVYEIMIIDR